MMFNNTSVFITSTMSWNYLEYQYYFCFHTEAITCLTQSATNCLLSSLRDLVLRLKLVFSSSKASSVKRRPLRLVITLMSSTNVLDDIRLGGIIMTTSSTRPLATATVTCSCSTLSPVVLMCWGNGKDLVIWNFGVRPYFHSQLSNSLWIFCSPVTKITDS